MLSKSAYLQSTLAIQAFIFLLIYSCLLSCKTKKQILQAPSEPIQLQEDVILVRFLDNPDYNFFSGKAKIKITSEYVSEKGTLYVRSIRDSVIWFAVKILSV